jgi:saccharopine dehydrogenase-like NADP-dependent oxidoreductase
VKGKKGGRPQEYIIEMHCQGNKTHRLNTTALTTGVGGAIVGRMLASGAIKEKGFYPIEKCVEPIAYFKELAKWGMSMECTVKRNVL